MLRLILVLSVHSIAHQALASEPRTKVVVNGLMSPVYFNDGDTFRVLSGQLSGTKARLEGFNTLESFGPVHQWGDWSFRELYVNAKAATLHARRGIWRCSWDQRVDGYGRGLFKCPELAIHMIRAGMAHAMTVTAEPSPEAYLEVQRGAMKNRRGMWAGSVPKYVLTSLHSVDESRTNGLTTAWSRPTMGTRSAGFMARPMGNAIRSASRVKLDSQVLREAKQRLDSVDELTTWRSLPARKQVEVLEIWLMIETVSAHIPKAERDLMRQSLTQLVETGLLVATKSAQGGCMIYTDYRRRFGGGKASCLKLAR